MLILRAEYGHEAVAQLLIESGAVDINAKDNNELGNYRRGTRR